jgi:hypothetical protein
MCGRCLACQRTVTLAQARALQAEVKAAVASGAVSVIEAGLIVREARARRRR